MEQPLEKDPAQKILEQQLALCNNAQTTAALMRFILQLANSNLMNIREQLLEIQELAMGLDNDEWPPTEAG